MKWNKKFLFIIDPLSLRSFYQSLKSLKSINIGATHLTLSHTTKMIEISQQTFPTNIYSFKVNNRNYRKRCETCLMLTRKTPEGRHC